MLGYILNAFAGITVGLTAAIADLPTRCSTLSYLQPHGTFEVADRSITFPLESLVKALPPARACLDTSGWMNAPEPLLPAQMLASYRI